MKLLDLFCGAGGAGMGYHRAGFDVTGVDINPQPRYPFDFVQGDALQYLAVHGDEYDVIHASPPCQSFSVLANMPNVNVDNYPKLIEPIRNLLLATGKPYIIENVPLAPLQNPIMLCGSMFGLQLIRHRIFETRPAIWFPPGPCQCRHLKTMVHKYSAFERGATAISVAGHNYKRIDGEIAMGINWMQTRDELSEAIPPAYTEWIAKQLLKAL